MSTAQAEQTPDTAALDGATEAAALELQEQPMISLDRVEPNPTNVREDLDLNPTFLGDLERNGIEVPILVRALLDEPGRVIIDEGHRRYYGVLEARKQAAEAGRLTPEMEERLSVAPYRLLPADGSAPDSEATSAHLRMYRTNHPAQRVNHTVWEQGQALVLAAEEGLTRRQIRNATGLKAKEVDQLLSIGRLNRDTVEAAQEVSPDWDLEDAALNAEFEDDPEALDALREAKYHGTSLEYIVKGLRRKKLEATEQKRVRDELAATGVTITEERPFGGIPLSDLRTADGDDGEQLIPENHQDCPGRRAHFRTFNLTEPVHYCSDPEAYGHAYRNPGTATLMKRRAELLAEGRTVVGDFPAGAISIRNLYHNGEPVDAAAHRTCPGSGVCLRTWGEPEIEYCLDYDRHGHTLSNPAAVPTAKPDVLPPKKVREGNIAWINAAAARRDWLKTLFARRTVSKDITSKITAFVAEHMVAMPSPVRESLTGGSMELFAELTGRPVEKAVKEIPTLKDGRRLLLALARIAAAYEFQLAGENERKKTWRLDTSNFHCSRSQAGHYLQFLIDHLDFTPSPIETAVAQSAPYTGDVPPDPGTTLVGNAVGEDPVEAPGETSEEPDAAAP